MAKKPNPLELARTVVSVYQLSNEIKDIPPLIDQLVMEAVGIPKADYDVLDIRHERGYREHSIVRHVYSRRKTETRYSLLILDDMRKCIAGSIVTAKKQWGELNEKRAAAQHRNLRGEQIKKHIASLNVMGQITAYDWDTACVKIGEHTLPIRCFWNPQGEIINSAVLFRMGNHSTWLPVDDALSFVAKYFVGVTS